MKQITITIELPDRKPLVMNCAVSKYNLTAEWIDVKMDLIELIDDQLTTYLEQRTVADG